MPPIMYYVLMFVAAFSFSKGVLILLSTRIKFVHPKRIKSFQYLLTHRQRQKWLDERVADFATRLAGYIKIDNYRRNRLVATLKAAGYDESPELYQAKVWTKATLLLLLSSPTLLFLPLLMPVLVAVIVSMALRDLRAPAERLRQKREEIERELPRFVATFAQTLKASRDVLGNLKIYRKRAGEAFGRELDITIADMRSGNEERALLRLEARVGSAMLSNVVQGLITVKQGSNAEMYFELLSRDLKQIEIQRLKLMVQKQPEKLKKYSFFMLVCLMLIFLGALGYSIIDSVDTLL